MNRLFRIALVLWVILGVAVPNLWGMTEFKKAFTERYAPKTAPADFQKLVRKTGCYVCHVRGKKRDVRNAYGEELAKLIPGDAAERKAEAKKQGQMKQEVDKMLAELEDAFGKVEAMKAADGTTYGERIKAGKLPVE